MNQIKSENKNPGFELKLRVRCLRESLHLHHTCSAALFCHHDPNVLTFSGVCLQYVRGRMCVLIDAFQGSSVIETPPHHKAVVCVMESQGHFMHHTCPLLPHADTQSNRKMGIYVFLALKRTVCVCERVCGVCVRGYLFTCVCVCVCVEKLGLENKRGYLDSLLFSGVTTSLIWVFNNLTTYTHSGGERCIRVLYWQTSIICCKNSHTQLTKTWLTEDIAVTWSNFLLFTMHTFESELKLKFSLQSEKRNVLTADDHLTQTIFFFNTSLFQKTVLQMYLHYTLDNN